MGLLPATESTGKPSGRKSKKPESSPGPSSLPDFESSKRIESLERELAEAKASGEASKAELAALKAELDQAKKEKKAERTHEQETGGGFFGY